MPTFLTRMVISCHLSNTKLVLRWRFLLGISFYYYIYYLFMYHILDKYIDYLMQYIKYGAYT